MASHFNKACSSSLATFAIGKKWFLNSCFGATGSSIFLVSSYFSCLSTCDTDFGDYYYKSIDHLCKEFRSGGSDKRLEE